MNSNCFNLWIARRLNHDSYVNQFLGPSTRITKKNVWKILKDTENGPRSLFQAVQGMLTFFIIFPRNQTLDGHGWCLPMEDPWDVRHSIIQKTDKKTSCVVISLSLLSCGLCLTCCIGQLIEVWQEKNGEGGRHTEKGWSWIWTQAVAVLPQFSEHPH